MFEIRVALGKRSYPIIIAMQQIPEMMVLLDAFLPHKRWVIVSEPNVWGYYADGLLETIRPLGREVEYYLLPSGESAKNLSTFSVFLEELLVRCIDKQTALIAFGGGCVGDVVGFAASILLRGIDYVHIPTTLLAQIDSAIGGKTGINSPSGKNLIGTIYQPKAVIIDLSFLKTLPAVQLLSGYAEILKYGIALDEDFFSFLESHGASLLSLQEDHLEQAVQTSCTIKANIVSLDEFETNSLRQNLNFGHTIGHALELYSYDIGTPLLHGEAIAIGMMVDCRLALKCSFLDEKDFKRIEKHYKKIGLPTGYIVGDMAHLFSYMQKDKKNKKNSIKTLFPKRIGQLEAVEYFYDDFLTLLSQDVFLIGA